ncbi:MAG: ATP-grasp domain-containing protein [Planctomycetia bacterium]
MRILVHEHYCCGGQAGGALDTSLLAEAAGMLGSIAADMHATGHDVVVAVDARVPLDLPVPRFVTDPHATAVQRFQAALETVDAALVVAPEHDGLLPELVELVERTGIRNLGSRSDTIRAASDKHALGERLQLAGIRTPEAALGPAGAGDLFGRHAAVVAKPNRGAGCLDTFVCRSVTDVAALPERDDWLFQEQVPGSAASAAFVVPDLGSPIPLRAGLQDVRVLHGATSARLVYCGGRLPLPPQLERRAFDIAGGAVACLPGLRGFVGVDLVLGADADGDTVIEINARPTVAYSALRRLARFNIADLLVGRSVPTAWREGGIRYRSDGTCSAEA